MLESDRNWETYFVCKRLAKGKSIMKTKYRQAGQLRRNILVAEDEYINRELLKNILKDTYRVYEAGNGQEAINMLTAGDRTYSLVLLDLNMPVMGGIEFLEIRRKREDLKKVPVIVMTADAEAEVRSIKLGAADFITKPYSLPEVILTRIERIIELSEDQRIIASTEEDPVTGLYTKAYFFQYIYRLEQTNAQNPMDALVLNADRFHLINELYGRQAGDEVLRAMGRSAARILSETGGIGCRTEGDTFFLYCSHQDSYDWVEDVIRKEMEAGKGTVRVRIRVGVYQNVRKDTLAETWFDMANMACGQIRENYTQGVAYYDNELHARLLHQERLIADLEDAIDKKELKIFFQPKYNIQGGKPVLESAEALIRWDHPQLGMINPGEFIPMFEANGLIQRVDYYVWREAAAQIRRWKEEFGIRLPISVNVSRIDVYDPKLEEKMLSLLGEYALTTSDFVLEVTESAYSDDAAQLNNVVDSLRRRGFRIEMDDFGTGYSSLNTLTTLPIDELKMDIRFIQNMQKDERSRKMVELILDIAHFLDMTVVAEGVEEESQYLLLQQMGCDVIQGYYFSRPVDADAFAAFIQKEAKRNV